jgi:hypothetical protein
MNYLLKPWHLLLLSTSVRMQLEDRRKIEILKAPARDAC